MKKPRHLSAEERALWDKVARRTEPLSPSSPDILPPVPAKKRLKSNASRATIPAFEIGGKTAKPATKADVLPSLVDRLSAAPVNMDQKSFGKMKRGKLQPEGRIDLHGMTLDQAHPALTGFIMRSHAQGKRLVLVITGKGKSRDDGGPIPTRHGVLRHQVPQWLALPTLRSMVLQVAPAHVRHGGHGAYYVYLRRKR